MRPSAPFVLFALVVAACSTTAPPPGMPVLSSPLAPPVGSSWVMEQKNTGSYGSTTKRLTVKRLPDREYENRLARVEDDGEIQSLVDLASGALMARTKEGTAIESFDPPLGWDYPVFVGKRVMRLFRYTDHVRGQSFSAIQALFTFESFGDVTVPAGTFKAFRVSAQIGQTRATSWYSPDLAITVKSLLERSNLEFRGYGTRESELVSYDIKR